MVGGKTMTCPKCGGDTTVKNTMIECDLVARLRVCMDCEYKFYTSETEQADSRSHFDRIRIARYNARQEEKRRRCVKKVQSFQVELK